jgi:hypothetical protein
MHLSSTKKYLLPQPKINTEKSLTAQNSIHILQLNVENFMKEGQRMDMPDPLPFKGRKRSVLR